MPVMFPAGTRLGLALRFTPLEDDEARAIKGKALTGAPLFTFPSWA
jgi:hypothetical protein